VKNIDFDKLTAKEICFFGVIVLWLIGILWGTIHTWYLIIIDLTNLVTK
jgi:hypothetical protein